jgi:hypothetical protein
MRKNRTFKPVLLNLTPESLEKIDICSAELTVTRTQFLRLSIERNIQYFLRHELPVIRRMRKYTSDFGDLPPVFSNVEG